MRRLRRRELPRPGSSSARRGSSSVYVGRQVKRAGRSGVAAGAGAFLCAAFGHVVFNATFPLKSEQQNQVLLSDVANVTPDDGLVVFTSGRGLTVEDTRGVGLVWVYEYDAQAGTLARVSIGRDGYNDKVDGFCVHGSGREVDVTFGEGFFEGHEARVYMFAAVTAAAGLEHASLLEEHASVLDGEGSAEAAGARRSIAKIITSNRGAK